MFKCCDTSVDTYKFYLFTSQFYLGLKLQGLAEQIILDHCNIYLDPERTIVPDNYYTSVTFLQ